MKRTCLFACLACLLWTYPARGLSIENPGAALQNPVPITFTVNSTYDEPDLNPGDGLCNSNWFCTLRAAIEEMNASAAGDAVTIEFDIEHYHSEHWTGRTWLIKPSSPLPVVSHSNIVIDASTQPGSDCRTLNENEEHIFWIELDGSNSGSSANGITIGSSFSDIVIKGMVINQHSWYGIRTYADNVTIECSYIGTDVTGTVDKGNGIDGIFVVEGSTVLIKNSLISGNAGSGVLIDADASDVTVFGNLIGAEVISLEALPNDEAGITDYGARTTIGGQPGYLSETSNVIAHNALDGVRVMHEQTTTCILGNSMFGNGSNGFDLGIDLGDDGITPNDYLDPDSGPNGLQNFPHKLSATYLGGTHLVFDIVLWTEPLETYLVEIFTVTEPGTSGHGEGRTPFAAVGGQVANAQGHIVIRFPVVDPSGWSPTPIFTATATRVHPGGYGPTSEYTVATPTTGPNITLFGSIFLEGAFSGGLMSTPGDFADAVPGTNPYRDAMYWGSRLDYDGWDAVTELPTGAIDWILFTLRSPDVSDPDLPGEIETQKAAFVRHDGKFIDLDGSEGIEMYAPSGLGRYWIEIGHRNHIGIISYHDFSFTPGMAILNFAGAMGLAYSIDGPPMVNLGTDVTGPFGLFAADINFDGDVQALDFNEYIDATTSGASGYQTADCNMDGQVQALDFNLYLVNTLLGASSQIP